MNKSHHALNRFRLAKKSSKSPIWLTHSFVYYLCSKGKILFATVNNAEYISISYIPLLGKLAKMAEFVSINYCLQ